MKMLFLANRLIFLINFDGCKRWFFSVFRILLEPPNVSCFSQRGDVEKTLHFCGVMKKSTFSSISSTNDYHLIVLAEELFALFPEIYKNILFFFLFIHVFPFFFHLLTFFLLLFVFALIFAILAHLANWCGL